MSVYKTSYEYEEYGEEENTDPYEMIGTFCGQKSPGAIRSKNNIMLYLEIHRGLNGLGFKFEYFTDSCGGHITKEGRIASPVDITNVNLYPHSIHCVWNITAPVGKHVVLRFTKLSLEYDVDCDLDSIAIYDWNNTIPWRLALLCGELTKSPPTIKSRSNRMKLVMETDSSAQRGGFIANVLFMNACDREIPVTDSAEQLTNPRNLMQDSEYLSFLDCHFTLKAPMGNNVQLTFNEYNLAPCSFHLSASADPCDCDFVEIRDGVGPLSPLIGKYCGHNLPPNVISTGTALWIRFATDGVGSSTGFVSNYESIPAICGSPMVLVNSSVQYLRSPGYPGSYSPNLRCSWLLIVEERERIKIHVTNTDIQDPDSAGECIFDYLEIFDHSINGEITEGLGEDMVYGGEATYNHPVYLGAGRPISTYFICGKSHSIDYFSESGKVHIKFNSDSEIQKTGFEIAYTTAECSRNYTREQGRLRNDDIKSDCIIIIAVPENSTISLYYQLSSLYDRVSCEARGIQIQDGDEEDSPVISKSCGLSFPNPVFSSTNKIRLKIWNHNKLLMSTLYDMTYTSSDKGRGCGGRLFNYGGVFTSPFFPGNIRNVSSCRWDVTVPYGSVVALKFNIFDIGPPATCNSDYVKLINIDAVGTETVAARYCGGDQPALFSGTTNKIAVQYVTSFNNGGSGWTAKFVAKRRGAVVEL